MKSIFQSVIATGGYDLSNLLKMIDRYHIEGKLSDADKDELYAKARGNADAASSIDVMKKLQELDKRVRKLEQGETTENPTGDYPEYIAGKWYYAGNKITYGGVNYVCVAPEGAVCTWSPAEYPAYWEKTS